MQASSESIARNMSHCKVLNSKKLGVVQVQVQIPTLIPTPMMTPTILTKETILMALSSTTPTWTPIQILERRRSHPRTVNPSLSPSRNRNNVHQQQIRSKALPSSAKKASGTRVQDGSISNASRRTFNRRRRLQEQWSSSNRSRVVAKMKRP